MEQQSDLNRQVVKSDYTRVYIPETEFEIPAQSQKGGKKWTIISELHSEMRLKLRGFNSFDFAFVEVTTVEGIIARAIAGLTQDQEIRRSQHPEAADQIDGFVAKLQSLQTLETPWSLELEDISGRILYEPRLYMLIQAFLSLIAAANRRFIVP